MHTAAAPSSSISRCSALFVLDGGGRAARVAGMKKQPKHRFLVRQYQRGWFATIRRPLVKFDEIDTFCIDTTTYPTKREAMDAAQYYAAVLRIELGRPAIFKMPKQSHA